MDTQRLLGIAGSLRRGSVNRSLLVAAQELAPEGVEIEILDGLRMIPPYSEDDEPARTPAEVIDLRQRITAADALLIATPEYNGSIPGQLKNALDWASRPRGGSCLEGNPAAVMGASPGRGERDVPRRISARSWRHAGREFSRPSFRWVWPARSSATRAC